MSATAGITLTCPSCGKQERVAVVPSGRPPMCNVCGGQLLPKAEDALALKGAEGSPSGELPPFAVPGYQLLGKIGQGGTGMIYRARQVSLDRVVAMKVILPQYARDAEYIERFRREALAAAALEHVNIVRIYDVGSVPGPEGPLHFITMEYVEGTNLGDLLAAQGPIDEATAVTIARQVAHALDFAHQQGIVHRDLKPENLMIDRMGVVKLMDLGMARWVGPMEKRLTLTGYWIGTPWYMSPELIRDELDIDIRADLYSLGAVLYNLVVGLPPFDGPSAAVILSHHLTEEPPSPQLRNPNLSDEFSSVIRRLLAKDRAARHQTPQELIEDLMRIEGRHPPVSLASTLPALLVPAASTRSGAGHTSHLPIMRPPTLHGIGDVRPTDPGSRTRDSGRATRDDGRKTSWAWPLAGVIAGAAAAAVAAILLRPAPPAALPAKPPAPVLPIGQTWRQEALKAAVLDTAALEPGLVGHYFTGIALDAPAVTRVDEETRFDWGVGPVWPGGPADGVSARWTGWLRIPETGFHAFRMASDDGARLIIDGRPVIENWPARGLTIEMGRCTLESGFHKIHIEWFEAEGQASLTLFWRLADTGKAVVIPKTALFHLPDDLK